MIERNVCLLSGIHTKDKPRKHGFSHYYQHHIIIYIPIITLIQCKTLYQFRRVTAIHFNFDDNWEVQPPWVSTKACPAALTTADQGPNSPLFGDLIYFLAGNDQDEPKNMKPRIIVKHPVKLW